jgi:Holliday junction DNA helicase RuvA
MIAFVRGHFIAKTPASVIVDVNGVGYELQISLHTYSTISNKESGQLLTYLHITENGQTLFGFAEKKEKELFLQLLSVSGIGAATARMILSGMKPAEIIKAVVQNNTKLLSSIKGIGKKTAERIVLELKDKFSKYGLESPLDESESSIQSDAVTALTALGIGRPAAETIIKKIILSNPAISLEDIIKQALKNL